MKQCPTCKGIFADDTLRYCLSDGSLLISPYDSEATHIFSPPYQPAVVLPGRPAPVQPTRQGVNPIVVYVLIAIVALLLGGGVVALVLLKPGAASQTSSPPPAATPKQEVATNSNSDGPAPVKTPARELSYLSSPAPTPAETPRPRFTPQPTVDNDAESDLAYRDCAQLRIMRNEIFARHGYIFQTEDMRKHFSRQSWYEGTKDKVTLSKAEERRVNEIRRYEASKRCPRPELN